MKKIVLPFLIGLVLAGCSGESDYNEAIGKPIGKVSENGEQHIMMTSVELLLSININVYCK